MSKAHQRSKGATSSVSQKKSSAPPTVQASPVPSAILQMQRTLGNQATTRYLSGQLQRKAIQRMGGPEEEELQLKADPSTLQMMGGPEEEELQLKADPSALQLMGAPEEEELQLKADPNALQLMGAPEEEELQRKVAPAAPVQRSTGSGGKMPGEVQAKMEHAFQSDFSDVNIHVGSQASEVGAIAYAQGNDIHFAQGKFEPHTQAGQELLGHELAHVVQQRQGLVQPTTEVGGLPVNDDPTLERDADTQGRMAAQTKLPEEP